MEECMCIDGYCVDRFERFRLCIQDCNKEWSEHRSYEKLQDCVFGCVKKYLG